MSDGERAPVGMLGLGVAVPRTVRTNDWWREHHPILVAQAEQSTLAKIWTGSNDADPFQRTMAPFLDDPFRGSVERRVLAPGERALHLEERAARRAIEAAGMGPQDVDLMIVASFRADQVGVGNAAFLARALDLRAPAWNLETACSSSVVALQTACAMVRAGEARRVLVVTSCTYSRDADPADSLSWFLGDGAGAFVVGPVEPGLGQLAHHVEHTACTCDTFRYDLDVVDGMAQVVMRASPQTGRVLHESSVHFLRACVDGVLDRAGLTLGDVDFFVFNTPTAWYHRFAAAALEVDETRTISTYPELANIGPALMPANLHRALTTGRIRRGDRVLLYAIGSVSTASAAVLRWSGAPAYAGID